MLTGSLSCEISSGYLKTRDKDKWESLRTLCHSIWVGDRQERQSRRGGGSNANWWEVLAIQGMDLMTLFSALESKPFCICGCLWVCELWTSRGRSLKPLSCSPWGSWSYRNRLYHNIIQPVYDKPIANSIFNQGKLKAFHVSQPELQNKREKRGTNNEEKSQLTFICRHMSLKSPPENSWIWKLFSPK